MKLKDFKVGTVALDINGDVVIVTEVQKENVPPISYVKSVGNAKCIDSVELRGDVDDFRQIIGKVKAPKPGLFVVTPDKTKIEGKLLVLDDNSHIVEAVFIG